MQVEKGCFRITPVMGKEFPVSGMINTGTPHFKVNFNWHPF